MIFLTVGTCPIPFDRLVTKVDELVSGKLIEDEVFAQIGFCTYRPKHFEYAEMMDKRDFDAVYGEADGVVGHAGIGTILMGLERGKPLLTMPRMKRYREHVNDHQVATAQHFESEGSTLVAYRTEELLVQIADLKAFTPKRGGMEAGAISGRIGDFLSEIG